MHLWRGLTAIYVQSSIHVALAVVSLMWISSGEFNTSLDFGQLLFVLSASILGYNYVRFYPLDKRTLTGLDIPFVAFVGVNLLAAVVSLWTFTRLSIRFYPLLATAAVITFAYAAPVLGRKNLRARAGLKIILVGMVWTLITVGIPVVESGIELKGNVLFSFLQRFFLVILLTLPFEIRDLRDDHSSLGTLPQLLGVEGAKRFGMLLGILTIAMEFAKTEPLWSHAVVMVYMTAAAVLMLFYSTERQGRYYASFWVEGIPVGGGILWWLLAT